MKNSKTIMIVIILVLGVLLYLSGGIFVHHSSRKNQESISKNIEVLQKMAEKTPTDFSSRVFASAKEELDMTQEQEKIIAMKNDSFDNSEMTQWFNDVIIMGDSIVEAASEYEWLNTSIVYGSIGKSVYNADELIDAAIYASPSLLFICFGVNDIENYVENVDAFISDYRNAILKIQESIPDTIIYVNALFPPNEGVADYKPFYNYLDEYNTELEALCQELNVTFIDSGFILKELPELYDADDIHPISQFYPLWFNYLADVAGLKGDE